MIFTKSPKFKAIVIGVSAGGIAALKVILPALDQTFQIPVLIVQHISADTENHFVVHFNGICPLIVKEAEDKEQINDATIYFAPPNYHMLVEPEKTVALSTTEKINFSRPSIDALFETAAEVYCNELVGVVLTGANADGAAGLAMIKSFGGLAIVQSPETAEVDTMPLAAITGSNVDHILPLEKIGPFLNNLEHPGNL